MLENSVVRREGQIYNFKKNFSFAAYGHLPIPTARVVLSQFALTFSNLRRTDLYVIK